MNVKFTRRQFTRRRAARVAVPRFTGKIAASRKS
jgi:hypothetical protein